jgi:acyl carrier protein
MSKSRSKEDLRGRIVTIVAEKLGISEEKAAAVDFVLDSEHVDSLDRLDITMAIEDEFSVDLEGKKLEDAKTIADIEKVVAAVIGD